MVSERTHFQHLLTFQRVQWSLSTDLGQFYLEQV